MHVDVSMLDGQIAILEAAIMRYASTGQTPSRAGNRHPSICPFETYRTADRPMVIAWQRRFLSACVRLLASRSCRDQRFHTNSVRVQHMDEVSDSLEAILSAPAAHWVALLEEVGVPCSVVNTVPDAVEHPQVQARNMIVSAGDLRVAGNPSSPTSSLTRRRGGGPGPRRGWGQDSRGVFASDSPMNTPSKQSAFRSCPRRKAGSEGSFAERVEREEQVQRIARRGDKAMFFVKLFGLIGFRLYENSLETGNVGRLQGA